MLQVPPPRPQLPSSFCRDPSSCPRGRLSSQLCFTRALVVISAVGRTRSVYLRCNRRQMTSCSDDKGAPREHHTNRYDRSTMFLGDTTMLYYCCCTVDGYMYDMCARGIARAEEETNSPQERAADGVREAFHPHGALQRERYCCYTYSGTRRRTC